MTLKRRYIINNDDISWRIVEDEVIILNLTSGFYYTLTSTGTRMWNLLERNKTTEDIIKIVSDEYGIDRQIVRDDIVYLFNELEKEDLIKGYEKER